MSARLRIALASDWYLPRLGGIERQVSGLADALGARGHDVRVVTTTAGADDDPRVVRVATARLPMAGVACSPGLVRAMTNAMRGCDVVHAHVSVVSPTSWAGVLAAHALDVPAVVTVHSVPIASARMLSLAEALLGWSHWRVRLAGVSTLVARRLAAALPHVPVAVLPNGTDVAWWGGAPRAARDGPMQVVSALRLHRKKRPLALLEAFELATRASGADARLVLFGDGPQRDAVASAGNRPALRGRVRLAGRVDAAALREAYARSDLFVLPCRLEAFGVAALEARCAGLPVVAMDESGVGDFLAHGRDALLARDDDGLAAAIASLLGDATFRGRLARGATPVDRHDWHAAAARHEACYREMLDAGSGTRASAPAVEAPAAMAGRSPSDRALSSR